MSAAWSPTEIDYLRSHSDKTNRQIAAKLGRTLHSVEKAIVRYARRTHEQSCRLRGSNQHGENNRNWKGGISTNHYHYKRIQKQRYPDRVAAREKVAKALKTGKLKRQPCELCGRTDTHAHHDDYSKPLSVRWLCPDCHRKLHQEEHMFINLTPHEINIQRADETFLNIPLSGQVARVVTSRLKIKEIDGVEVFEFEKEGILDLPKPKKGSYYIVSNILLDAAKEIKSIKKDLIRNDLYAPGELIRDEHGQPVGCRGLTR